MKNREMIYIAIAEKSVIIRTGVMATLNRLPNLTIQSIELSTPDALADCIRTKPIDILIVNPFFGDFFDFESFKEKISGKGICVVGLVSSSIDPALLQKYDETISIFDTVSALEGKVKKLKKIDPDEEDEQETLSQREKEIVVCVAQGMTNKEIADELFLSIHTVNTHRKNISKKLQIHSVSGLTIYAIVNKLVDLEDIND